MDIRFSFGVFNYSFLLGTITGAIAQLYSEMDRIVIVQAQKTANAGTGNILTFEVNLTDYKPGQYMVIAQNVYCSSHEPHSTAVPEVMPKLGQKSNVTCYMLGGKATYANYYILRITLYKIWKQITLERQVRPL